MDAEELRNEYNKNFDQSNDTWSIVNSSQSDKIARNLVRYLRTQGYHVRHSDQPKKLILDVGCAKGYITESLRKQGFEAHGLDYSSVAVSIASTNFPGCHFFEMNGFEPDLSEKYDVVFMKGFSGTNTHNLDFVSEMVDKYLDQMHESGWFILAYSTNYSGIESNGETANWTRKEMLTLSEKLKKCSYKGMEFFEHSNFQRFYRKILNAFGLKRKEHFYLIYQKGAR